jgi:hypothetical protein
LFRPRSNRTQEEGQSSKQWSQEGDDVVHGNDCGVRDRPDQEESGKEGVEERNERGAVLKLVTV